MRAILTVAQIVCVIVIILAFVAMYINISNHYSANLQWVLGAICIIALILILISVHLRK